MADDPKSRGAVYVSQDGNVHYNADRERIDSLGHVARRSDGTVERLPEDDLIPLSWFDEPEEEKPKGRPAPRSLAAGAIAASQAAVLGQGQGWGFVQARPGKVGLAAQAAAQRAGRAAQAAMGQGNYPTTPQSWGGPALPPNSGGGGAPVRPRISPQMMAARPGLVPPSLGPGFPAPHEWQAGYQSPAGDARRTQDFGENPASYKPYGLKGHEGVDWSMEEGTPVQTMAGGVVENVGSGGAYGNYVSVRHPDGNLSYYAHLSDPYVGQGDLVNYGTVVGESGNTGNSTGPHLHASIRPDGSTAGPYKGFANPDNYIGSFDPNTPLPVRNPTPNFTGWSSAGW